MAVMRASHAHDLMSDDIQTVKVRFDVNGIVAAKTYDYKALKSLEVKIGDLLIVETGNDTYKIVQAVEVDDEAQIDTSMQFDYKWIVDKIDLTKYAACLEREKTFAETYRTMEKSGVRRSFAAQLAVEFGDESIAKLTSVLKS